MSEANISTVLARGFHPALNGHDSTMNRVVALLRDIRAQEGAIARVTGEARLADLGFSSVDMVKVMLATEAEFDLTIPQQDITPENFTSANTIAAMLRRLLVKA